MSDDGVQQKTYWVQTFSETTWREFLESGGTVTGFGHTRWSYIQQQLKPGHILLCYLNGLAKWAGILEVASEPYPDLAPIWKNKIFPCRVDVKVIIALPLEKAISVHALRNRLSIFKTKHWGLYFITSPAKWKLEDGRIVEAALLAAK